MECSVCDAEAGGGWDVGVSVTHAEGASGAVKINSGSAELLAVLAAVRVLARGRLLLEIGRALILPRVCVLLCVCV